MTENENNWKPGDPDAWKPPETRSQEGSSDILWGGNGLKHWILDANGEPVLEPSLLKWAECFEHHRRVANTNVGRGFVSTIFLGIDPSFSLNGPPILWETMVFGHGLCGREFWQERCGGSREQALAMHRQVVRAVKQHIRFPKPSSRKRRLKLKRHADRRMKRFMQELDEARMQGGLIT